jgi:hypothetical protein
MAEGQEEMRENSIVEGKALAVMAAAGEGKFSKKVQKQNRC